LVLGCVLIAWTNEYARVGNTKPVAYSPSFVHIAPVHAIDILVADGVLDSALALSLDVLSAANRIAVASGRTTPFRYRVLSSKLRLTTSTGRRAEADAKLGDPGRCDVLIVLGTNVLVADELEAVLARGDIRKLVRAISSSRAKLVCASCCGTFLCAEAGILDGKSATTSWWLGPLFRKRYPEVSLSSNAMVVPDGRVVTAGAALAHVDLMLWLVRHLAGPTLARRCTQYLVVDERPSQSRYMALGQLVHDAPELVRAEAYVRANLNRTLRIADLAKAAGVSSRTLERRTLAILGISPVVWMQRMRMERAVQLAETSSMSVAEITRAVGYANETSLRRVLVRELGAGVSALRAALR
jgi:transcriptional regulator GlxA family with amidase domain